MLKKKKKIERVGEREKEREKKKKKIKLYLLGKVFWSGRWGILLYSCFSRRNKASVVPEGWEM
jgi:hypothetical protein